MLRNARSRSSMSRWLCLAATLVLLVSLAPPSASASAGSAAPPSGKVEQRLLDQFERRDEVTFWVVLRERADLSRARGIPEWARRGRAVVDTLRETADRSQGGIRGLLRGRRIEHRPFWITNTIRVRGDEALAAELAARREVARVVADRTYDLPEPVPPGKEQVTAVEWNIDRIGAPRVWSTFGSRGEGVVVANIDTGVQFDHPALLAQYRGNLGDGFDHDYNWFDPSQVCGSPSLVPCDNAGHGTHTMGTMVGDDGDPGPNQIGVAPRARWIAAKGCEDFGCSLFALLSSGQWVLAPTRLDGTDPRPDLRPHVVNNSWGGGPGDPFFQATVEAWVAAGIFPQFSNGNSGPDCGTSGSPGDYPAAYSAGAFDIDNAIAGFSSRGPSASEAAYPATRTPPSAAPPWPRRTSPERWP